MLFRSFEAEPFCRDAVRIRRWDDAGKVAGLATPKLEDYGALINSVNAPARYHGADKP